MPIVIEHEMGLTHAEFFRSLPAALAGQAYQVTTATVRVGSGDRHLLIQLSPESERRIALLRLPVTRVRFEFYDYSAAEVADFMRHFERRYQRGGG